MRIGELAALAGVTTRTVRHYHHLGLLPEPARRANGYRQYGLRDAVTLARVRRLTELGLGLVEVRDVLADDAGRELREVLAELDADLARQEEEIRRRRERLGALLGQVEEGGQLPAEGPYSEQLTELFGEMRRVSGTLPGPEPAMAAKEREMLEMLELAAGSENGERMVSLVREAVAPPGAMERIYEVYALLDELAEAGPDDPRVAQAARALAACIPVKMLGAVRLDRDELAVTAFEDSYFADLAPAQEAAVRQAIRLVMEPGEGTT
ncbi:MerR family transcriptional regulator [Streptomyces sp. WAC 06725]|uniref:MerR family transcriptional regulator n=1 Tax=Streptomyces sp. WAC 06725 TaxID=2203209 RepID=UPI000F7451D2|nr:MerR family transcriptional regulator [Streptomyces sp. WAC 06725]RSO22328.1 MerR family transcriptional regulator [Streptomyces sp. WAC 06725]